jgi:hypothetical protein
MEITVPNINLKNFTIPATTATYMQAVREENRCEVCGNQTGKPEDSGFSGCDALMFGHSRRFEAP